MKKYELVNDGKTAKDRALRKKIAQDLQAKNEKLQAAHPMAYRTFLNEYVRKEGEAPFLRDRAFTAQLASNGIYQ